MEETLIAAHVEKKSGGFNGRKDFLVSSPGLESRLWAPSEPNMSPKCNMAAAKYDCRFHQQRHELQIQGGETRSYGSAVDVPCVDPSNKALQDEKKVSFLSDWEVFYGTLTNPIMFKARLSSSPFPAPRRMAKELWLCGLKQRRIG